ncbi:solute carrier organic anion transporter family member 3A1-like [Amphiura filiformis]|uniref:solute carrier organic anion transporter family member 3A1-like n=1 Tax=Amphiura filiformis TaxID=82378 RepID=UPI003B21C3C5
MSSGYFQLVFSSGEDDGSAFSDEDESDVRVHFERPKTPPPPHQTPSSSSTSSPNNTIKAISRDSSKTRAMAPMTYKAYLVFYTLLILLTGCACRAYLHGILRLIQRTVYVTDAEIRIMAIAYDIGLIFALVPLCCSNNTIHRPKLIGGGAAFIGLGFLLACIPYFIMRTQIPRTDPEKNEYELCIPAPTGDPYDTYNVDNQMTLTNVSTISPTTSIPGAEKQPWSTIWIIMAMLVAGVGSAPQFVLGLPYIEDTIRRPPMAFCIALVLSSHFGGIWVGQLASFFMWHHISVADPEILTRWWLGFFVAAMGAFVCGLVIFMFKDPGKKQPEAPQEKTNGSYQNSEEESHSTESPYYQRLGNDSTAQPAISVPGRIHRLSRNVPFISVNFGGALEAAMLTGLLVFLPRYLGSVTSTGIAPAQLFGGSAIIFGVIIGVFLGACLLYFKKWSTKRLSKMALLASVPALCLAWTLFFFHCGDPKITIGVKVNDDVIKQSRNLHELLLNANITAPCDLTCPPCSPETITPVCGADHLTYLSPCFAGCSNVVEIDQPDYDGHKSLNFTDCTCVNITRTSPTSNTSYQPGYAIAGVCAVHCSPAWLFWLILCAIYILAGIQYTPHLILMIRCVVPRDRTAALSILVIFWHLVGYIPALIYFSFALNKSCILWSDVSTQKYHECEIYDSGTHHMYFCTLVVFLKSFSVVSSAVTYKFTKDNEGERIHRDWVNYDVLEMDSYNRRSGNVYSSPSYI